MFRASAAARSGPQIAARTAAHVGVLVVLAVGFLAFLARGEPAPGIGLALAFGLALFAAGGDLRSDRPQPAPAPVGVADETAQRAAYGELYDVVTADLAKQVDVAADPTRDRPAHFGANGHSAAGMGPGLDSGLVLAVFDVDAASVEERDRRRAEIERVMQTAMHAGYLAAKAGWPGTPVSRVCWAEGSEPVIEFLQRRTPTAS